LTRRANHRHMVTIAAIRCPRRETGRGFFFADSRYIEITLSMAYRNAMGS
jgi:hypothetical protein